MTKEHVIIVEGLVQGVCFRALVKERAQKHLLKGSVRNLNNGTVEICLQGDEKTILSFLTELEKNSGKAKITKISSSIREARTIFDAFTVVY